MKDTLVYSQIATLAPHGYISAANVNRFQQELTQAVVSKEYSLLLVDMKEVEFLDSAGLMALVNAFRLAQKLGKHLSICSLPSSVRIIFELTQLDKVFSIFDNRACFEANLRLDQRLAA